MKNLHQWLNIANLHDKYITGIRVNEGNCILYISYDSNDSNTIEIVFVKPKHIRLDDFTFGNIILSIEVYESEEIDLLEDELLYLMNCNKNNVYQKKWYEKAREQIINEKLLFIAIDPSYGLKGFIVCEDIKTV